LLNCLFLQVDYLKETDVRTVSERSLMQHLLPIIRQSAEKHFCFPIR